MLKKYVLKLKDENANSVIEATFVVTVAIIIIAVLIMWSFLFYQETLLQSAANRTASDIASTYPYKKKDPVTGYIGINNLEDQGFWESAYMLSGDVGFNSKNALEVEEAKKLCEELIDNNRLLRGQDYNCTVEIKSSDKAFFQQEITVTVSETYSIPFAKMLGIDNSQIKREYTGYAQCVDIIGAKSYYNMLNAVAKRLAKDTPVKIVNQIVNIMKNFTNAGFSVYNFVKTIFFGQE